jgi:hypothetical protein
MNRLLRAYAREQAARHGENALTPGSAVRASRRRQYWPYAKRSPYPAITLGIRNDALFPSQYRDISRRLPDGAFADTTGQRSRRPE